MDGLPVKAPSGHLPAQHKDTDGRNAPNKVTLTRRTFLGQSLDKSSTIHDSLFAFSFARAEICRAANNSFSKHAKEETKEETKEEMRPKREVNSPAHTASTRSVQKGF